MNAITTIPDQNVRERWSGLGFTRDMLHGRQGKGSPRRRKAHPSVSDR